MDTPPFALIGEMPPRSPVLLSVPHGGRDYPRILCAALRVPLAALQPLEDRHIDAVAIAARRHETMIVQHRARAWIDLNRREDERDPLVDTGAAPIALPAASAKVRSGLGLVPRRVGSAGELWRRKFTDAEVTERIVLDHRPYHAALGEALSATRARFGVAVLLDLHSMPPLGPAASASRIVIGDRFGASAAARFVSRIETVAQDAGFATALNAPYAGGHILERHGAPASDIHAIQVEIDRSLYLDRRMDAPGPGFDGVVALLRRILAALEEEALAVPLAAAAE